MGLRVSDAEEEDVNSMGSLLLADEKQFSHPKRSRRCKIRGEAILVIIGVCLGFVLTGSIYIMINFRKQTHPQLALISVQFAKSDDFQNISHSHDQKWENLLTENNGFFFERNRKTGQMEAFGISMFHQLHCLTILRTGLQNQALATELAHRTTEAHESRSDRHNTAELPHLLHCMDYLRQVRRVAFLIMPERPAELDIFQAILCHADPTVEPSRLDDEGGRRVDGMIWRQCRDSGVLYKKSAESKWNNGTG